jgi:hypothetical protein
MAEDPGIWIPDLTRQMGLKPGNVALPARLPGFEIAVRQETPATESRGLLE